ncbi:MAG: hypothetical protein MHM6MM_006668 [Cercozoa sp. M6MM]
MSYVVDDIHRRQSILTNPTWEKSTGIVHSGALWRRGKHLRRWTKRWAVICERELQIFDVRAAGAVYSTSPIATYDLSEVIFCGPTVDGVRASELASMGLEQKKEKKRSNKKRIVSVGDVDRPSAEETSDGADVNSVDIGSSDAADGQSVGSGASRGFFRTLFGNTNVSDAEAQEAALPKECAFDIVMRDATVTLVAPTREGAEEWIEKVAAKSARGRNPPKVDTTCCGYLMKRGRSNTQWKRRFCLLDGERSEVFYFINAVDAVKFCRIARDEPGVAFSLSQGSIKLRGSETVRYGEFLRTRKAQVDKGEYKSRGDELSGGIDSSGADGDDDFFAGKHHVFTVAAYAARRFNDAIVYRRTYFLAAPSQAEQVNWIQRLLSATPPHDDLDVVTSDMVSRSNPQRRMSFSLSFSSSRASGPYPRTAKSASSGSADTSASGGRRPMVARIASVPVGSSHSRHERTISSVSLEQMPFDSEQEVSEVSHTNVNNNYNNSNEEPSQPQSEGQGKQPQQEEPGVAEQSSPQQETAPVDSDEVSKPEEAGTPHTSSSSSTTGTGTVS